MAGLCWKEQLLGRYECRRWSVRLWLGSVAGWIWPVYANIRFEAVAKSEFKIPELFSELVDVKAAHQSNAADNGEQGRNDLV